MDWTINHVYLVILIAISFQQPTGLLSCESPRAQPPCKSIHQCEVPQLFIANANILENLVPTLSSGQLYW